MGYNKLELYVHLVWSTWDRQPLITSEIERILHRLMHSHAHTLGCQVLALNGIEDHVHVVLQFPATLPISTIVKEIKATSSLAINDSGKVDFEFKWQAGYGAFTVSRRNLPSLIEYVKGQKAHHANNTLYSAYEIS